MRRSRGVSLIELIVVLAILGVATTLAAPPIMRGVEAFTLNSAGRRLVSTFRSAQTEAKLSQREVIGVLSGKEFAFWKDEKQIALFRLPADLAARSVEERPTYIFLASGQILGPDRLELATGGGRRGALLLEPTPGRVRFQEER